MPFSILGYLTRRQRFEAEDREELFRLRIGLASEDIHEQNRACSKIFGIHWMPNAQVDADKIIFDYKRSLKPERLLELEKIEKSIIAKGGHNALPKSGPLNIVLFLAFLVIVFYGIFLSN